MVSRTKHDVNKAKSRVRMAKLRAAQKEKKLKKGTHYSLRKPTEKQKKVSCEPTCPSPSPICVNAPSQLRETSVIPVSLAASSAFTQTATSAEPLDYGRLLPAVHRASFELSYTKHVQMFSSGA